MKNTVIPKEQSDCGNLQPCRRQRKPETELPPPLRGTPLINAGGKPTEYIYNDLFSSGWTLPYGTELGGKYYRFHSDFRDILEIFGYFSDPDLPPWLSWQIALTLFYGESIAPEYQKPAMEYLVWFVNGGHPEGEAPGPKLLDWEQDRSLIAADVNKAAGQDVRGLPYLHWWTFLSWFHAIGEGQLSTVVAIRSKLSRGKKLEDWEKDFYREHKKTVDIKRPCSRREREEKQRLEALLEKGR